jgi:hypothetical protein
MMFEDGVWYPGTITACDLKARKLSITFEDGDVQRRVPFTDKDLVFKVRCCLTMVVRHGNSNRRRSRYGFCG